MWNNQWSYIDDVYVFTTLMTMVKVDWNYSNILLDLFDETWQVRNCTCLASLKPWSSCLVLSADRDTTLSQRCCTLASRFFIRITSCFWLKYFRCVPVLSRASITSRWAVTSFCNTCTTQDYIFRHVQITEKIILKPKTHVLSYQSYFVFINEMM